MPAAAAFVLQLSDLWYEAMTPKGEETCCRFLRAPFQMVWDCGFDFVDLFPSLHLSCCCLGIRFLCGKRETCAVLRITCADTYLDTFLM
ncbi:hypothetical protein TNIN_349091 [Trichonephila inaurata madagascariensis]|uniref:Uncharacterized protein n=1 Tax=Trichonephila inaurata madagascariensis TaxID=2747483 RepID=A0A8X7C933_9ARAC|nr:hypothetical protein TNIN_349091 [Trichonephila inaurata madagascariensis]